MFCSFLAVYLLLFSASYYLHSPSTASGTCYRRSACIDTDVLRLAAAVCCDMGWISSQRGVLCDWSVSKKTGSMYWCRRWSLWTLAVTLLAWHSSCHTPQPVLFRATDDNPQLALFRASSVWKNATNLQSDEKALQFAIYCGDIFRWGGQVDYSLFSSEITNNQKYVWIMLFESDFFGFPKVKWLHLTGEVDKSVRFSCQILSGFTLPKIVKIG